MYDIAISVAACLRAGTQVDVAWAVETRGFSARDHTEALMITPGGGRVGSVMSGSLNERLAELAGAESRGRLVDLRVGEVDALVAGLACGGDARCLILPATELPVALWERLDRREPVCLVTRLDGTDVVETSVYGPETIDEAGEDARTLFRQATSGTAVAGDAVITVWRPIPKLVIIGRGAIAEALVAAAGLLGWNTQTMTDADEAATVLAELSALDNAVVISHDAEIAGRALMAVLSGGAGYVGALGSRRTQEARARWLAEHGVTELDRIHGPAGLDIGASTPGEIAVSILAEALAVRSGTEAVPLGSRPGPIHASALEAK
ncbi:XdhC family protein [Actinomadura sp. DC4]|uniref:XdhC family protein n=1 Tax=Actinomadura sp. DC4 TaxID=3055069 RepID=UPI0025B111F7|nr:XdhC family protein [Actinomadura sp. DC4]MDN3353719.1 XdhC family protein [Actinomadura sp. DC4]